MNRVAVNSDHPYVDLQWKGKWTKRSKKMYSLRGKGMLENVILEPSLVLKMKMLKSDAYME